MMQSNVHKTTEFVVYFLEDRQPVKVVPKCCSDTVRLSFPDDQAHSSVQN